MILVSFLANRSDRITLPSTRCHNTGADLRFVLAAGCGMFIIGLIGCGRGNAPTTRVGAARSTTVNGSSDPSPAAPAHTPGTNHFADESGLALLRKGSPSWFTDRDDPSSDGWDSEVFSQRATAQLKDIAKLMSQPSPIDLAGVEKLAAADFSCAPLRPPGLEIVFRDKSLTVSRAPDGIPSNPNSTADVSNGEEVLAESLRTLLQPLRDAGDVRAKFKLFLVTPGDSSVTTQAYYEASSRGRNRSVQQNALWTCRWNPGETGQLPRLEWIGVEDFEEVASQSSAAVPSNERDAQAPRATLFADCSEAVLGRNPCFHEQLAYGQEHWIRRIQNSLTITDFGHHGLAVGDVNGDGLEDVYVPQTGGLPNRLFVQSPDGTATDGAAAAGVDFLERTQSALLLDLDNDGDQDLAVATSASLIVLANDGSGHFTQVADLPPGGAMSMTAADYDNDGDLDLYVCHYTKVTKDDKNAGLALTPIPYHDANNGAANVLLRNDADWRFTDVTDDVGLDQNNRRWSFAASWEDYDKDGDLDLYVANDYGRNNLYRNDPPISGGQRFRRFVDVAAEAGVEDIASGMSISWGDYNRDGWMDIYVSNMFSAAGNRVTFQRQFQTEATNDTKGAFSTSRTRQHAVRQPRRRDLPRCQPRGGGHHGAVGVGWRCSPTSTTTAGKIWLSPTDTLPTTT